MRDFIVRHGLRLLAILGLGLLAGGGGALSNAPAPLVAQVLAPSEWSTLAANPQRTSNVTEQPTLTGAHLDWYRPIDAYIPQNAQIIAGGGLLYVPTSRGLVAIYADDPD